MKKFLSIMMVSAMTAVTFGGTAYARTNSYTDDIIDDICDWLCGSSVSGAVVADLPSTSGESTFKWLGHSKQGEPNAWADIQAGNLKGSGDHPELGKYTFSVDNSRPEVSQIRANQASSELPFSSTLRFHVTLTFDNQPDVVYRSINPVELQNSKVEAWPYDKTNHLQIGTTDFEDDKSPGVVALTLSGISADVSER